MSDDDPTVGLPRTMRVAYEEGRRSRDAEVAALAAMCDCYRAALEAIVEYVDKDRKKFVDSFVMNGPRAALPLYNLARAALHSGDSKGGG